MGVWSKAGMSEPLGRSWLYVRVKLIKLLVNV